MDDDDGEDGVMAQAAATMAMTIAEFDAFVASVAEGKHFELFDGTPLLMSNPNETHDQIAANIGANLKLAMDKRGCRTYQGGMMVQASAHSAGPDKFRPDIVVRRVQTTERRCTAGGRLLVLLATQRSMNSSNRSRGSALLK